MFLAVKNRKQDIPEAGEGDATAGFAAFGISQVDQMQTTPAAGD